ncbi:hypothetical protein OUZ56_021860 [Daphnia magna]|uniref:Uncharacterized protein n=1 Tax=Daphnia magna TaxID=35525 RepID=A0ABR0AUN5_9CRUS|nr:hypothetical protein OUZ56_021860 [Daphnia magna]
MSLMTSYQGKSCSHATISGWVKSSIIAISDFGHQRGAKFHIFTLGTSKRADEKKKRIDERDPQPSLSIWLIPIISDHHCDAWTRLFLLEMLDGGSQRHSTVLKSQSAKKTKTGTFLVIKHRIALPFGLTEQREAESVLPKICDENSGTQILPKEPSSNTLKAIRIRSATNLLLRCSTSLKSKNA